MYAKQCEPNIVGFPYKPVACVGPISRARGEVLNWTLLLAKLILLTQYIHTWFSPFIKLYFKSRSNTSYAISWVLQGFWKEELSNRAERMVFK